MITKRVFDDARDKNVANFVVYAKTSDSKLYYDLTATSPVQVTQADVEDAFAKGRLIVIDEDGTSLTPIAVKGNKVTTAKLVSTTLTATEWAAKATAVG